jgi:Bacterial AMP nucleoside phosphorylase N-terminus
LDAAAQGPIFGGVTPSEVELDKTVQHAVSPEAITTEAFYDAAAAVGRLTEIYERNTEFLRQHFAAYLKGKRPARGVRACYPFVRITTGTFARVDSRLSYGFSPVRVSMRRR